jgi:hypothetical protein
MEHRQWLFRTLSVEVSVAVAYQQQRFDHLRHVPFLILLAPATPTQLSNWRDPQMEQRAVEVHTGPRGGSAC